MGVDGGCAMAQRRGASWEQYRLIADNSSDVVYETEPDGTISVDPAHRREPCSAGPPDELRGVEARSLVHPDDLEMVNRPAAHGLRRRRARRDPVPVPHGRRLLPPLHGAGSPVRDGRAVASPAR